MPNSTFFNLPEEKRDRIIEAAMDEFSQNHYGKVTIDKIAKKAEIPKGSFYQYFENKDDLYIFLFGQIGNKKKHILEETRENIEQLDFKSYIMLLLEEGSKFESKDIKLVKLKAKFINECPQEIRKEILKNEYPKSYDILMKAIKLYIEKRELRANLDMETTAYIITQCMSNIEFYNIKDSINMKKLGERILDTIIEGIKS
jgi:AcrR family transcriptional regulator